MARMSARHLYDNGANPRRLPIGRRELRFRGLTRLQARGFDGSNVLIQVRLHMTSKGWFSRIPKQQPSFAMYLGMIVAIFLAVACIVAAQGQSTPPPAPDST